MSCAFENGKFFIGSGSAPPLLRLAGHFRENSALASAALTAAKQLITTEESVKVWVRVRHSFAGEVCMSGYSCVCYGCVCRLWL